MKFKSLLRLASATLLIAPVVHFPVAYGQTYRLDTITGQTWTVNETALDRIKESGPLPEGNFDLEVVPVKGDREHWVVRIDRKTGRMWYASEGRWQAYSEKP